MTMRVSLIEPSTDNLLICICFFKALDIGKNKPTHKSKKNKGNKNMEANIEDLD